MKNTNNIAQLTKEYNNLIASIKGYIKDSKTFNFEPIELKGMMAKSQEISKQLKC
jgi:hypothetical protein